MANTKTVSDVKIKPVVDIPEPPLFKVIYINDEQTSMEFVVRSLVDHFNYTTDTAATITMEIHESGSSVVAILPYEIAEQKGVEVTMLARAQSYPLQIKLEPEIVG